MVIGDDDLEPARARVGDLLDRRDPAIHGEDEADAVLREPGKRVAGDAVAFLEPAREVPDHICAQLPEDEHGERGRADSVHVVVAVNADARAGPNRGPKAFDRSLHVPEE